jgi:hypothetical protein
MALRSFAISAFPVLGALIAGYAATQLAFKRNPRRARSPLPEASPDTHNAPLPPFDDPILRNMWPARPAGSR